MRILILHHNRYYKIRYDVAIDHDRHDVCYAGLQEYLDQIPQGLRYTMQALNPEKPVEEQLRAWLKTQPPFDRILTRQENLLITAAELREAFGIPGMTVDQIVLFRDKIRMKDAILAAGIRAPRYRKAERGLVTLPWSGKTILKPRDGAGSRGIKLFATAREALAHLSEAVAAQPEHPYLDNYELEEFLEGPIWHVDGYLFRGSPVAIRTSKYIGTCLDYEFGKPLGSIQFDHPALAEWAVACLRALKAENITFHLEAILTEDGPAFLEVAGRAGGGDVVETFERATGIHLHALDMASDVHGNIVERFAKFRQAGKKYGFFMIPGHGLGGAPCRVLGVEQLLRAPIVEEYRILPEDRPTPRQATYQAHDLPLSGIVSGRDPLQLEHWMRRLFARVQVTPACLVSAAR